MKKFSSLLVFTVILFFVNAQVLEPVKWSFSTEQASENEFNLIFNAKIDDKWYLYSQDIAEDGPIPTSFNFDDNTKVEFVGKTSESGVKTKEGVDEMFDVFIRKYAKGATFIQKVKITENTKITGYLEFMTCDDERCLPPETIEFSFDLIVSQATPKDTELKQEITSDKAPNLDEKKNLNQASEEQNTQTLSENSNVGITPNELTTESNEADLLEPVVWDIVAESVSETETKVSFIALIEEGWYLYSQFIEGDGPVPTTFYADENFEEIIEFNELSDYKVEGFDEVFEIDLTKYKKQVVFSKVFPKTDKQVSGVFEFMTCNDEMCLPPEVTDYSVNLNTLSAAFNKPSDETANSVTTENKYLITTLDLENPVSECGFKETSTKGKGIWAIFLLGFAGGLIALLTPCVFPMIPLTVTFFTKGSEKNGIQRALTYGFFIFIIYTLLSTPFYLLDSVNPEIFSQISTNVWLNLSFGIAFLIFAVSFFGYFEITLPSSVANKVSSAESAGGFIGIFFMALTLVIVSFSCTGPILGTTLVGALSANGGAVQLTAALAGFGLALALPFAVFAAFPKLLNKLPQSGGWMNTLKVILAFAEVALALKFFSNADLVKHWGILKYEVFMGLWILVGIGIVLYLLGFIKFPHDAPMKKIPVSRWVLAGFAGLFVVYLAMGFRYNSQTETYHSPKLLAGLAPPVGYSWVYPKDCPENFNCFHDYWEGVAYAKEENKPILIDFTGHACVNCRKVEQNIWSVKEVHDIIDKEFVLISLYVDEKIDLPEEQQEIVYYNGKERKLRNVGNKWAYFQALNFKQLTQPQYALMSPNEELLAPTISYSNELTAEKYANFLRCGLANFEGLAFND